MEDQYQEQLRQKDIETFQTKKEMNMLRYQLNEAQRRLELPVSMQLAEAQKKIHRLENIIINGDDLTASHNEDADTNNDDELNEKSNKERKLEKKLKTLQNQLDSSTKTIDKMKLELDAVQLKSKQKEMEYRRLIAASCNLPIDKVDGLIGPLTLAIESDPLDLDMTRVIGFMEKLKKQQSVNAATPKMANSPHDSTTATTPV